MKQRNTTFYVFMVLFGFGIAFFSLLIISPMMMPNYIIIGILFAIVLLFIFLGVARSLTSGALEERSTRYIPCPHCEKEISLRATYCQHCGKPVSKKLICDYCGHENAVNEKYCNKCNALLDTENY